MFSCESQGNRQHLNADKIKQKLYIHQGDDEDDDDDDDDDEHRMVICDNDKAALNGKQRF